jgi:two-component system phosphate regulon sensor histidine kinase PhoR
MRNELIIFIILSFCGIIIGKFSELYLMSLCLTWLIYSSWHFYQILHLYISIRHNRRLQSPYPFGIWKDIYQFIARYQQRSRKRKRNLTRFAVRFKNTATNLPDALVILDNKLNILWANNATTNLLGFTWNTATGKSIIPLLNNEALLDYIKNGTFIQPLEMVPKHNNALILSVRITPFGSKKRQKLLIARDVTQLHLIHQIRKDFVANVSHELRTPLTIINGYVENILDTNSIGDSIHHSLQRIHFQTARMTSLIQDLLALSQLETDEKVTSHHNIIDIPKLIRHIILEANSLGTNHQIETDIDNGLCLIGSENEIYSAFSNLIFNAIKHTKSERKIFITWRCNQIGPVFSVKDTGDGIAIEHIPRLTERFYRVDKSRSRTNGGTGLGLSIVKHVLTRHNADLHIASAIGNGSVFSCQFSNKLIAFLDTTTFNN